MSELVLRVFHWWGRYCLHLTFNACLRTHGRADGTWTRKHSAWKADALASWTTTPYRRFLSQPLYKYYITIFKKNQIFTFQNLQVGVVIWSCGAKPTLQFFVTALTFFCNQKLQKVQQRSWHRPMRSLLLEPSNPHRSNKLRRPHR